MSEPQEKLPAPAARDDTPPQSLEVPDVSRVVVSNLPWVVGIFTGLLVLLKVAAVSRFDVTTALTIISVSNQGSILLGTSLLLLPQLLQLVLIILIFLNVPGGDPYRRSLIQGIAIPLLILVLFLSPAWSIVQVAFAWLALDLWPSSPLSEFLARVFVRMLGRQDPMTRYRELRTGPRLEELRRRAKALQQQVTGLLSSGRTVDKALGRELQRESQAIEMEFETIKKDTDGLKRSLDELKRSVQVTAVRLQRASTFIPGILGLMVMLILVGAATDDTPWLPLAQFSGRGGMVLGYMLADTGQGFIVLREGDRRVVQLEGVGWTRGLCKSRASLQSSSGLLNFKRATPQYVDCSARR